ncbi:hypothetical protein O3P69_018329 [Scylla paramamosain]|uniref:Uncharacterized protein n=1 Tax=Scylla paramamosain TaxID=85552 RepID=A0AAW0TK83_SCYPA
MDYLPGYTGHVRGAKSDCGRRLSILAAHNTLTPPPTPTPALCDRLDDLQCLRSYEARVKRLPQGLPLPDRQEPPGPHSHALTPSPGHLQSLTSLHALI